MPGEVEGVPGLKQARDAFDVAYHGNGKSWQDALALALVIAEPEIRSQERQRVREALLFKLKYEVGPYPIEQVEAALDSLEDGDA